MLPLSAMFLNLLSLLHFTSPFLSFTHWSSCLSLPPSPSLLSPYCLPSLPFTLPLIRPPCPFHTFVLLFLLAAVAEGGTKARRATATGGTNTRRARGARRAKRPARRSAQTKKIRRPWSSDHHLLFSLPLVRLSLRVSHQEEKEGKGEDEHRPTKSGSRRLMNASCHSPSHQSQFHPAVVQPHHHFRRRMDEAEEVVKEGMVVLFTSPVFPSQADIRQDINLSLTPSSLSPWLPHPPLRALL